MYSVWIVDLIAQFMLDYQPLCRFVYVNYHVNVSPIRGSLKTGIELMHVMVKRHAGKEGTKL